MLSFAITNAWKAVVVWAVQRYDCRVPKRDQWRPVLEAEMKRWSEMSCAELVSALTDVNAYEVEFQSEKYQVEVQLLENTDEYIHVGVSVDDGHFWRAMHPLFSSFICKKRTSHSQQ